MISMNLSRIYGPADLYIVDSFAQASMISQSPVLRSFFSEIRLYAKRTKAIIAAAHELPNSIFIDSDVGLKTQLALIKARFYSPKSTICVYEEGIGTYRTDLIPSPIKQAIYTATGTARYFGGSIFTNKIFVYNTEKYHNNLPDLYHKAVQITPSHRSFINEHREELIKVFGLGYQLPETPTHNRAYIYLTDWEISADTIFEFNGYENAFIKPHPHLSKNTIEEYKKISSSYWVPSVYPAELIIPELTLKYHQVCVRHNNSSAMSYMGSLDNILEI
jgi:hypothetical protein